MNDFLDKIAKLSGLKGSIAAGVFAFMMVTVFNRYHPFDFSMPSLSFGVASAAMTIVVIQIAARLTGSGREYALMTLASAVLFYFLCWNALFRNDDGRYDPAIALSLWLGFTVGGVAIFAIYRGGSVPRE